MTDHQVKNREVTADLHSRHATKLASIARRRLGWPLSDRVYAEEIVCSVFRTFLRRRDLDQMQTEDAAHLWYTLRRITLRKTGRAMRKLGREVHPGDDASGPVTEALARDPDPSEAVVLADLIDRMLQDHPHIDGRELELLLAGHTEEEIAGEVGRCRHTVGRHRAQLGEWMRAHDREGDGDAAEGDR